MATRMEIPVPGLPPFDTTDEPNTLWLKWKKWIMSFNLYLAAKGVDSDGQKVALLLCMGGMEFQEIFYQIVPENAQLTFDQTVQTLDRYFQPKMNLPFEKHLFRKMEQAQHETVYQFVSRLRQKAISCGFGNVDEAIRDQVIEKCRRMHLRRKFLEKSGNILLKDLQDVARVFEAVDLQMKATGNPGATNDAQVNVVNKNKPKWKGKGNDSVTG